MSRQSLDKFRGQPLSAITLADCYDLEDDWLQIFQFAAQTSATVIDLSNCPRITGANR